MSVSIAPAAARAYAGASATAQGAVTAAGAGQNVSGTIAAASLPAGLYEVVAAVYMDGTIVPATDDDNIKLNQSGGGAQTHLNMPGVAGDIATTRLILFFTGAQTIAIQANAAASAAAVYHAALTCTPLG